jgi:hypothetical protein
LLWVMTVSGDLSTIVWVERFHKQSLNR